MDFLNYKFRASSVGNLMTKPRNKTELLSETAKAYLLDIYIKEMYGRERDINNKFIEKGLYTEEESFNLIQNKLGGLVIKNTQTFENNFIRGTPDLILNDCIVDAKSSWNIHTFLSADGTDKNYIIQGNMYMDLKDKQFFKLAYCLNNAPEHLIVNEKQREMYKRGLVGLEGSKEFDDMENFIDKNMKFDDIDKNKRIKIFDFEKDEDLINKVYEKIVIAREYLNNLNY